MIISQERIVLNFCVGYLSVRYSKLKEPTLNIISTILKKESSKTLLLEFLQLYSAVHSKIVENTSEKEPSTENEVVQQSESKVYLANVRTAFFTSESASLNIIFEDFSRVLSSSEGIVAEHFQLIFDQFLAHVCKRNCKLTSSLAAKLPTELTVKYTGMVLEKKEESTIPEYLQQLYDSVRKSAVKSRKSAIDYRYFYSFCDALSQVRDFSKNTQKDSLKIIFQEAISQSSVALYEKGVRALLRMDVTLPLKIQEFFGKLNEKYAFRDALLAIDLATLTKSETDKFLAILTPVMLQTFFKTRGQKNRQEGISKQKFILNYFSGLSAEHGMQFLAQLTTHIGSQIFIGSSCTNDDFKSLGAGAITKLLMIIDLGISVFGLQLSPKMLTIANYLVEVYVFTTSCVQYLSKSEELTESHQLGKIIKVVRRKLIDLLTKIYATYLELNLDSVTRKLLETSKNRIEKTSNTASNSQDSIVKLLFLWSEFEIYKVYFVEYEYLIPAVLNPLGQATVSKLYAQKTSDFVKNLITFYPGVDERMEAITNTRLTEKLVKSKLNLSAQQSWKVQGLQKTTAESVIGLHLLRKYSNILITALVNYIEHTGTQAKQSRGVNQPFVRELLIIVLQRCVLEDQQTIERISNILCDFLNPKLLLSLSPQSYSAKRGLSTEEDERFTSKIEQVLQIIDILALVLREKADVCSFFMQRIIPIITAVSSAKVFLGLRAIFEAVIQNIESKHLWPSLQLISSALTIGKRMDHDLDYDTMFEALERAESEMLSFDKANLQVLLTFAFKLISSQDLSVRIKTQDMFRKVFENYAEFRNLSVQELLSVLKVTFDNLPNALKMSYSSEDCVKNFVEIVVKFGLFVQNLKNYNVNVIDYLGNTVAVLDDVADAALQQFLTAFFNPKLSTKAIALNELLHAEFIPSSYTVSSFLIPVIENVMFLNLARHMSEMSDNNFKLQSSKKAHLTNIITAVGRLFTKLTHSFTLQKLTGYISKKLNLLETHAEFQHPILVLLSSVFENFSRLGEHCDAITVINEEFAQKSEQFESIYKQFSLFKDSPKLKSYRVNYKQMATGKMKKVRREIHGTVDFNVSTMEFLKTEEGGQLGLAPSQFKDKAVGAREKLQRLVLVRIKKLLFNSKDDEENIELRFALCECFLKVLRLFPAELFKVEFAKLVMELAQLLKNKDSSVRDKTMRALFKIVSLTGPYLLQICISEITSALAVSSYRHVRNYAIWYILNQIYVVNSDSSIRQQVEPLEAESESENEDTSPENAKIGIQGDNSGRFDVVLRSNLKRFTSGSIDHIFSQLADIVCEETYTDMFEEKTTEDRKKKTKEIKKHKAKDILRLFTMQSSHPEAILKLAEIVVTKLREFEGDFLAGLERTHELFVGFSEGVMKNTALNLSEILVILDTFYARFGGFLATKDANKVRLKAVENETDNSFFDSSITKERLRLQATFKIQDGAASGKSVRKLISETRGKAQGEQR